MEAYCPFNVMNDSFMNSLDHQTYAHSTTVAVSGVVGGPMTVNIGVGGSFVDV